MQIEYKDLKCGFNLRVADDKTGNGDIVVFIHCEYNDRDEALEGVASGEL